jgi:glyoxylase-like metal-dependent hydrolase (beta-lactamase superfamily II)
MSQYEIYALKYAGPFIRTGAHVMWYQDWEKVEKINYYIWCIKGAGETVVVDTGVTPQIAAERELEGYVNTAGGTAIIGSDCAHVFRNYREDWPSALIVDLVGWMKTYDKLRERVSSPDLLFPGHDRLLLENYQEVASDITRLV